MKALYEMLRVARRAVIMIEPNDQVLVDGYVATMSRIVKNGIKKLIGRSTHYHHFESGGNYVYAISRREMEKVALGMGLRTIAFKWVNDYYLPGVEFEPAVAGNALFRTVSREISRFDFLCRLGISQPGLLAVVFFKETPSETVRAAHRQQGFRVKDLPRNPYLDGMQGLKG